jgi:ABC-type multidrug transport system ATPase subunit
MSESYAVEIENLSKSFGRRSVFQNFSMKIVYQSASAIIGPNGSGKTTLLKMIGTLVGYDSGVLKVAATNDGSMIRKHISAFFPNQRGLFPNLNVRENLRLKESLTGGQSDWLIDSFLGEIADLWPHELSVGMRQMVHLAKAAVSPAKIFLFDEPYVSLDVENVAKVNRLVERLRGEKATVLLAVHERDVNHLPPQTEMIRLKMGGQK